MAQSAKEQSDGYAFLLKSIYRNKYCYYLDLALPIKEASKGFALASSFLVLALSVPPGLASFVAFFMRWAVAKPRFLYKSVFFIAIYSSAVQ